MLDNVKRSFLFRPAVVVASGTALVAATYGLVRLAFGLHLPEMSADLGVATETTGLVSAAGSLVYGAAALVGFLIGRDHPRLLVLAATATAGGGAAGIAAAQEPVMFAAASAVSSAGAGLASPALVRIVHRAFGDRDAATAQTVVNAGTGPGLVAAGLIALALTPDWRLAWAIGAAATLAAGAAVLVADGPGRAADPTGHPGDVRLEGRGTRAPLPAAPRLPPRPWWRAHRVSIAAAVLFGVAAAAVWNYGRTVLVHAGASDEQSVLAWVMLGCGGAAEIVTAPLGRRLSARRLWLISTAVAGAGTLMHGLVPAPAAAAAVACALFGWGYVAATGALIGWTSEIDPDRAAAGTAILFVVFMVGQAAGAAALGAALPTSGAAPAFGVAAGAALAAGLLAIIARGRADGPPRGRGRTVVADAGATAHVRTGADTAASPAAASARVVQPPMAFMPRAGWRKPGSSIA